MNPSLFAPHIGEFFSDAATELTDAAREFLQAEVPQVPVSDALLVCFFTQKQALIAAVFEQATITRGPLVGKATLHFRQGSAPKMLLGITATIILAMAQRGITRPDECLSGMVVGAMKRIAEPCQHSSAYVGL